MYHRELKANIVSKITRNFSLEKSASGSLLAEMGKNRPVHAATF